MDQHFEEFSPRGSKPGRLSGIVPLLWLFLEVGGERWYVLLVKQIFKAYCTTQ